MRIVNVAVGDEMTVGIQLNGEIHAMEKKWAKSAGVPNSLLGIIEHVESNSEEDY